MTAPAANTINICLAHIPFPARFARYVDLMIVPRHVDTPIELVVVPEDCNGPHAHTLSEYNQLLWLFDHFARIVGEREYVRLFTYRRFCASKVLGVRAINNPWSHAILEDQLAQFEADFSRVCDGEVFNTLAHFEQGMLRQYADAHDLGDLLAFAKFMLDAHILDKSGVVQFLARPGLVPACSAGVFRREHLHSLLAVLRRAAQFMHTPAFVARTGAQRRNMGFLLERLNSHLLLAQVEQKRSPPNFGYNIVISDSPVISVSH